MPGLDETAHVAGLLVQRIGLAVQHRLVALLRVRQRQRRQVDVLRRQLLQRDVVGAAQPADRDPKQAWARARLLLQILPLREAARCGDEERRGLPRHDRQRNHVGRVPARVRVGKRCVGIGREHGHRAAVARRGEQARDARVAGCAGNIRHPHRRRECELQNRRAMPRQQIGAAAGPERHDDFDRFHRQRRRADQTGRHAHGALQHRHAAPNGHACCVHDISISVVAGRSVGADCGTSSGPEP